MTPYSLFYGNLTIGDYAARIANNCTFDPEICIRAIL